MATVKWRGDAPAVAQVDAATVTSADANGTLKVTINGKVVSTPTTGVSNTDAATLQGLLATSTIPEFQEVKWTVATNVITGTAGTPGMPFTATYTVTGGASTFVGSTTTTSTGPSDIKVAANWTGGSGAGGVPGTGDDLYAEIPVAMKYNLDAYAAVALNSVNFSAAFTAQCGLPAYNGNPGTGYFEYRKLDFQFLLQGTATVTIGYGPGQGSGLIRLDTQTAAGTLIVQQTAASTEANSEAVRWKGNRSSGTFTVEITRGNLGLARRAGETATVDTLYLGYQTNIQSDATVVGGAGLTLTTLTKSGGQVTLNAGCTTITQSDGITTVTAGNVTTWTVDGGTAYYYGTGTTGTIATLNIGNAGTFSVGQDLRTRTITTINVYKGWTYQDPAKTVTFSTWNYVRCRNTDGVTDWGENRSITAMS